MNWKVLKTEEDYNKASIRMMELFHNLTLPKMMS